MMHTCVYVHVLVCACACFENMAVNRENSMTNDLLKG